MISKAKIKYIKNLESKKNRKADGLFVAEGPKVVGDLMNAGFLPQIIVSTKEWIDNNFTLINSIKNIYKDKKDLSSIFSQKPTTSNSFEIIEVSEDELRHVSFLVHPQQVLAVFKIPHYAEFPNKEWFKNNLCIALDGIQDPGNMGTIIRIADWFGIDTILCSKDTVDAYSPKVVQATMGSIARVKIHHISLIDKLRELNSDIPIYGTLLDGHDIYKEELSNNGIIIMGNEGNGISKEIREIVNNRLLIPSFPPDRPTAESLNVAIATAIVCAEFRRKSSLLMN